MINHTEPEDFVVSTMTTHSVREMVDYVFKRLGMDYRDYVTQNPKFMTRRIKIPKGDSTKIRETLGWKPEYTFETLMDDMVDSWDEIISKRIK
jgi:GDPmannose 4,6-dehydratase